MKLVQVEQTFDNSRLVFYFTANGRVDFRSLVKDLASVFHTRIELTPNWRTRRSQDDRRALVHADFPFAAERF